jgi:small subunit ribosomal protein S20
MANHKQAEKRNRQRIKRRVRNLHHLTTMRTHIKRVRKSLADNDAAGAKAHLPVAVRAIDRAVTQGILHRKTASRYVSRLTVAVSRIAAAA